MTTKLIHALHKAFKAQLSAYDRRSLLPPALGM